MRRPSNGCATMRSALAPPDGATRHSRGSRRPSPSTAKARPSDTPRGSTYSTFLAKPTMYWKTCSFATIRGNRARGQRFFEHVRTWAPSAMRAHGVAGARLEYAGPRVLSPSPGDVDEGLAGVSVHILGAKVRSHCAVGARVRTDCRWSVRRCAGAICTCWTFCTDGSSFEPTSVRRFTDWRQTACTDWRSYLSAGRGVGCAFLNRLIDFLRCQQHDGRGLDQAAARSPAWTRQRTRCPAHRRSHARRAPQTRNRILRAFRPCS